ncbi:MAG TPA: leucine-rich repeat protein, partial [Verrucomicrobiae bacterium]|nr:leucine-rich repeat protein [Verrucomicrobiae bacterium]
GTYGPEQGIKIINGTVIISGADVTLQNTTITGNLLFAAGIGEGNAVLKNVAVKGYTIVNGGGSHSITLEDCTLPKMAVAKDAVRVVASGNTSVEEVQVKSAVTLLEADPTGPGFRNVNVSQGIPRGASVNISGNFEKVNVQANINMVVQNGTVNEMNIAKNGEGATVILSKQTAVKTLTIEGPGNVKGEGKIETVNINSNSVVIEQTPAKLVVSPGVTAKVGDREISEGTTNTSGTSSSGGSSTVMVQAIAIDQQDMVRTVGETVQLTVAFDPANSANRRITWLSDNETVATISPSGLLTAVNEGMAIITATVDDKTATTILAVRPDSGLPQLPGAAAGLFTYSVTDGKAEVTGYSPDGPKDVVIPNTLGGYPVTRIGPSVFDFKWINSVRIPDGVTSIGNYAFAANNLTSLDIPDSVISIGYYAFGINKLTSVTIPDGVASIADYAFSNNHSLTSIIIPDSTTSIGSLAFWNSQQNPADLIIFGSSGSTAEAYANSNHYTFRPGHVDYSYSLTDGEAKITGFSSDGPKDIVIPRKLGGYPVTSIGQNAFAFSQLSSLTIPFSVTGIEDYAFANIQLPSISIPSSVTSIGKSAFADGQLTTIVIPGSVTSISRETFARNKLTSVTISDGVTSIGDLAFSQNCLTSVIIPDSVTSIGLEAFNGNQSRPENFIIFGETGSAAQVYANNNGHTFIPVGMTYNIINGQAEITGYSLVASKDVVIPQMILGCRVTSIGNDAFRGKQLTSVIIPNGVTRIGDYAFYQNQLVSVTIPAGVTSIGDEAFNSNALTSVAIPDSVTSIGGWAFQNNQLTSATLPRGLTSIETSLFAGNHLTSINIPVGVTQIGSDAFLGNQLSSISIPNSVTYIGGFAFTNNRLTSVVIPGSVKMVGMYAFSQNSIKAVVIPKTVEVIGENAFWLNQDYHPENLVFFGTAGSVAENYANSNKHTFVALSPGDPAGFLYSVTNGKGKITGYRADAKDVVIPRTLGGYSITSIGDSAFVYNNLSTVTIPNSVTSIGERAFAYNNLNTVTIPSSVTSIGRNAFAWNKLTSVTIPQQVITIGDGAFNGNQQNAADFTIYGAAGSAAETYAESNGNCFVQPGDPVGFVYSVTDGKGKITGYSSSAPRDVVIPGTLGGHPITGIDDFVFCDKGITSVSMPGSLKSIGGFSFWGNRISTLIIPQGVTSIGDVAFWGNRMTFLIIPDTVTSIGHNAFCGNLLTTVTIPGSVISIGSEAFEGNRLTSVIIPDSVTSIGDRAFSGNQQYPADLIIYGAAGSAAETYAYSNGHTFVEYNFQELLNYRYTVSGMEAEITGYDSTGTRDIVIPGSLGGYPVTSIGRGTIQGKQLTSVSIPNGVKIIGDDAFKGNQLASVIVPDSVTSIGSGAFAFNQLTSVTIPQSVTSIGAGVFAGNQQRTADLKIYGIVGSTAETYANSNGYTFVPIFTYAVVDGKAKITGYSLDAPKDVVIPATLGGYPVTSIDELVFAAYQLTSVSIPESVTSIGNSAFMNNELKSAIIPDGVTSIGRLAFASNQLTSVNIPDSLTSIGTGAFDSNQLTSVEIPVGVTTIGEYAFYRNQLTSVTIPDSVTSIGNSAFASNQLTSVTIPDSVTSIGNSAFASNQLTSVTIPDSVTGIGNSAFASNQLTSANISGSLTSIAAGVFDSNLLATIVIPDGVTSIGDFAFHQNQLTLVIIPDSVSTIGSNAFEGNQLTSVTIPDSVTNIGDSAFAGNQQNPAGLTIYGVAGSAAKTYANSNGHTFEEYNPQDLLRYVYTVISSEVEITGWNSAGSTAVVIPGNLGGYPVTSIGNGAFQGKQLASVVIPESVTSIGANAFKGNKLNSVIIADSVTSIGSSAFDGNQQNPAALLIYGAAGSAAETYANSNGHTFIDLLSYVYTVIGLEAEITGWDSAGSTDVVIPSKLGGYPVT